MQQEQQTIRRPKSRNKTRRASHSETSPNSRGSDDKTKGRPQLAATRRHKSHGVIVVPKSYKINNDDGGGGGRPTASKRTPSIRKTASERQVQRNASERQMQKNPSERQMQVQMQKKPSERQMHRMPSLRKNASERTVKTSHTAATRCISNVTATSPTTHANYGDQLRQNLLNESEYYGTDSDSCGDKMLDHVPKEANVVISKGKDDGDFSNSSSLVAVSSLDQSRGSKAVSSNSSKSNGRKLLRTLSNSQMKADWGKMMYDFHSSTDTDYTPSGDLIFDNSRRQNRRSSMPTKRGGKWQMTYDFHSSTETDFSPSGDFLFDNSCRQNRPSPTPPMPTETEDCNLDEEKQPEVHKKGHDSGIGDEDSILLEDLQLEHNRRHIDRRSSMPNLGKGGTDQNNSSNPHIVSDFVALKVANAQLQSELELAQDKLQKFAANATDVERLRDENSALQKRNSELEEKNAYFVKLMGNLERLGKLDGVMDKEFLEGIARAADTANTSFVNDPGLESDAPGDDNGFEILTQGLPETRPTPSPMVLRSSSCKFLSRESKMSTTRMMRSSSDVQSSAQQLLQHPRSDEEGERALASSEHSHLISASDLVESIKNTPMALSRSVSQSSQDENMAPEVEQQRHQQQNQQSQQHQEPMDHSERGFDADDSIKIPNFVQFPDIDEHNLRCSELSVDVTTFHDSFSGRKKKSKQFLQKQRIQGGGGAENMSDIDEESLQLQEVNDTYYGTAETKVTTKRGAGAQKPADWNHSRSIVYEVESESDQSFKIDQWQNSGQMNFSITDSIIAEGKAHAGN